MRMGHTIPSDCGALHFRSWTHDRAIHPMSALFAGAVHLKSLRSVLHSSGNVTFFGAWAAVEGMKPQQFLHESNNPRGQAFEMALFRYVHPHACLQHAAL